MTEVPSLRLHCLACGSMKLEFWSEATDVEYLTTDKKFNFYRCYDCQALSINPVPRHQLAQIYPPNYYSFVPTSSSNFLMSWVQKVKQQLDQRLFKKILSRLPYNSLNVLDVGGGTGWELKLIKQADPRVQFTQVVDIDPAAADAATRLGHHYFCGRIEEFYTKKQFDFVLLLNLIEHVENPLAVLQKVHQILSPQGVALVKTPNYHSWDATIFRHQNWGGYHCPRHWVLFTKESFEHIARQAGLEVAGFSYTQGAPFWAISIFSWLVDRGWISITKKRPAPYHPLYSFLSAAFAAFDFLRGPFTKTSQMFFILARSKS